MDHSLRKKIGIFVPDLVFMEIRLPGETGLELTKKIEARHSRVSKRGKLL